VSGLRVAALVTLVCGHLAAVASAVLPLPALLLSVPLAAAGAVLAGRADERTGARLRAAASGVALVLALLAVPRLAADDLRSSLGLLLVGVSTAQAWTWSRTREVGVGVLAGVGLLVLGASFAPDVLVGLPLLVGWVAAVVAVVLVDRSRTAAGADVVLHAASPRGPVVTAGALAAVLGVVAFLLVPVPEDSGLRSRLAASAPQALSGRGQPGAYTGTRVDLRTRGDLSDAELVRVAADTPPLWRSAVYVDWDGTSWTTPGDLRRLPGPPYSVGAADGPVRVDRVEVERRASGPVFAPGPVVSLDLRGRAAVDSLGAVQGFTDPGYVVTSRVVAPSDAELRAASGPDVDDPRWTALPPSLPARVRDLGVQLAGSAPSRLDAVRAVEDHLRSVATYSLDSPVPGPGEDAVDRFLFVDRVGFCEQFAAAEVLLLRAAGIPARFVTGLGYGVVDDGRRTFRQKDLHAWVEVFHPGVGWVASDPTPPTTQLASASLRVQVVAWLTARLRQADDVPGGRPALAAGLLAVTGAVAAGLLLRRRRAPAAVAAPVVVTAGRPGLAAFLRWDARRAVRRRPSETLAEVAARVEPPVAEALGVVEAECYAPSPPADVPSAVAVLDRSS
jgi:protein-glutamine gamma-glutamyltransferase